MLSVPVHVRILNTESRYYESISIREEIAGDYDAAYWTAYQRVYMIEKFRATVVQLKGDQSSEQLAKEFGRARLHSKSDKVDAAFVESALTLYRRVLNNPVISEIVRRSDEDFAHNGPFAKVSVLSAVMKKASSPELIEWVVCAVNDLFRNNMMSMGELSWDSLTGYRSPGNKGTVDLLLYKKDMLTFFLEKFVGKHAFDNEFVSKLRHVMQDHLSYRTYVEPSIAAKAAPDFQQPDISYRASWKKSGRLVASLIEECVFNRDHDGCLKIALKARKIAEEVCEYERFKERITEILDSLAEEKKKEKKEEEATSEAQNVAGKEASEKTGDKAGDVKALELLPESPEAYW